jgi:hypothetical protein
MSNHMTSSTNLRSTNDPITQESVVTRFDEGLFNPHLIPKAYAFVPETEHPVAFTKYAQERIPIPTLEKIEGTARPASEQILSYIRACPDAGAQHLKALTAALNNASSLAILTLEGAPVATLKRSGYGMPNVLAFRYATLETENDIVHPLIPGGIYITGALTISDAWQKDRQRPIVPIDRTELYPVTMFLEKEHPRTARHKFTYAESLFEKIIGG